MTRLNIEHHVFNHISYKYSSITLLLLITAT